MHNCNMLHLCSATNGQWSPFNFSAAVEWSNKSSMVTLNYIKGPASTRICTIAQPQATYTHTMMTSLRKMCF